MKMFIELNVTEICIPQSELFQMVFAGFSRQYSQEFSRRCLRGCRNNIRNAVPNELFRVLCAAVFARDANMFAMNTSHTAAIVRFAEPPQQPHNVKRARAQ